MTRRWDRDTQHVPYRYRLTCDYCGALSRWMPRTVPLGFPAGWKEAWVDRPAVVAWRHYVDLTDLLGEPVHFCSAGHLWAYHRQHARLRQAHGAIDQYRPKERGPR